MLGSARRWCVLVVLLMANSASGEALTSTSKPVVKLGPQMVVHGSAERASVVSKQTNSELAQYRLLDGHAIESFARVLGNHEGHQLIQGQHALAISGLHKEKDWAIYRYIAQFKHQQRSIYLVEYIARAKYFSQYAMLTQLTVQKQSQEIRANDIALPISSPFFNFDSSPNLSSTEPYTNIEILGFANGAHYAGKHQSVVLKGGQFDGIHKGDVFDLVKPAQAAALHQAGSEPTTQQKNTDLPQRSIGQLTVVASHLHFSLAVITQSHQAVSVKTQLRPLKQNGAL